jgi:hypothetical protein
MIGIFTGALNPGGQLIVFITLSIGLLVGICLSSWWKGLLGAALISNAIEVVTLVPYLWAERKLDSLTQKHKTKWGDRDK